MQEPKRTWRNVLKALVSDLFVAGLLVVLAALVFVPYFSVVKRQEDNIRVAAFSLIETIRQAPDRSCKSPEVEAERVAARYEEEAFVAILESEVKKPRLDPRAIDLTLDLIAEAHYKHVRILVRCHFGTTAEVPI